MLFTSLQVEQGTTKSLTSKSSPTARSGGAHTDTNGDVCLPGTQPADGPGSCGWIMSLYTKPPTPIKRGSSSIFGKTKHLLWLLLLGNGNGCCRTPCTGGLFGLPSFFPFLSSRH